MPESAMATQDGGTVIPIALTIAGSDSCAGAGIQGDLKTFAAHGVHGASVVTSITAQNTQGVHGIHEVPIEMVSAQMDAVLGDMPVRAIKTGMLGSAGLIETISERLSEHPEIPLVVDPVMVSQSGSVLLPSDAKEALLGSLISKAQVVTPNLPEAEALSGKKVRTLEEMKDAAKFLIDRGAKAAFVKGGHGAEERALDVLYDGESFHVLEAPRLKTQANHGTGCCLASAIVSGLALGQDLLLAAEMAKGFVWDALKHGLQIGKGHGCVNPLAERLRDGERLALLDEMREVLIELETGGFGGFVPEVQANLAVALWEAESIEEVAAVPGRIIRYRDQMKAIGDPAFGASSHVARIVLAVLEFAPENRAAMNIRWEPEILEACRRAGLSMCGFDRADEPQDVTDYEGGSLPFGVRQAMRDWTAESGPGSCPDIIEDPGGPGKEPMIRLLAESAGGILDKLRRIDAKMGE